MRLPVNKQFLVRSCLAFWNRARHHSSGPGLTKAPDQVLVVPEKIRNIGIAAHIDAGKTTTTERMLFYAGVIRSLGEVHKGDTVMDYMEQERARGITITSASISFQWMEHCINLIDTPGHVDFTVEVEKALRVLDGAVAILDASAGVEAQTLTVWRQADKYLVPRIAYLNKMDKAGADFHACLHQMERKLKCLPLAIQLPVGEGRDFRGLVDLVALRVKEWEPRDGSQGKTFSDRPLDPQRDGHVMDQCLKLHSQLVDQLSGLDDELADLILERESLEKVTSSEIQAALRRVTLQQKAVPVTCGSSYRNMGVQPLMDAVVRYLPGPNDRRFEFVEPYRATQGLCALAFKIQNDVQRGLLTFVRLYHGSLELGQKVYNVSQSKAEKINRLYVARADELTEVSSLPAGNIAVVSGLKETLTGDTLTSGLTAANAARRWLAAKKGLAESHVAPVLAGVQVPDPVFFCSIEPSSLKHQKPLEQALDLLQKEDPSLKVTLDPETGQTVVAGMGELHLEIILERIRSDFKVDATLGPFQVAYKETVTESITDTYILDRTLAGTKHWVKLSMTLQPDLSVEGTPILKLGDSRESREQLATVWAVHLKAVQRGVANALSNGPLLSFPVTGIHVILNKLEVGPRTSEPMVTAAAAQCLAQLLQKVGSRLMEPVMRVEVTVEERHLQSVLADLAQHRSNVLEISQRHGHKVVVAECPLAELRGYSTRIRILTSGTATFTMELSCHKLMTPLEQQKALQEVTGLI